MKTFRVYLLLSVFALTLTGWTVCHAEQTGYKPSPENLHSLVITFSAPTHNRVNLASQLGSTILSALKAQPENIAQQIDVSGGGWALTSNLSGVQLAFFASENPWDLVDHALVVLNKLSTSIDDIKNVPLHDSDYEITLSPLTIDTTWQHISFDVSPSLEEYVTHLETSIYKLQPLYQPQSDVISLHAHKQPLMAKILHWPACDLSSFFSAKFIGEQFLKSFFQSKELSYEIIYSPAGIHLLLLITGTESELFQHFEPVNKFTAEITNLSKTHWAEFQAKAEAILGEDSRDFRKALLSSAWTKHFNQSASHSEPHDARLSFARPSLIKNQYAMPQRYMLSFTRSQNHDPRIVTARHEQSSTDIDMSIAMQGDDHIISSIVKGLNSPTRPSFTFSSSQPGSDTLIIHFYNTHENVPDMLRTFHDFIKTLTPGPGNLDVAIASAGNLPPFVLKGIIESSWPGKRSTHHWSEATQRTFADLTGLAEDDATAIHQRWKLLTATPRGKTELLAKLAIAGRFINSFDLPIVK